MNPNSNESAGLNLPPPVAEQVSSNAISNPESQQSSEAPVAANTSGAEHVNNTTAPSFGVTLPDPMPSVSNDEVSTTSSVVPVATNDSDLIDKHIVDKAKAIIMRTREDPYQQSEELTVFKAEHLRKNYNRTIKTKPSN